jgi:predicted RNA-binding protein with PIN domain
LAYLIDGNNFLGHIIPSAHRQPGDRRVLTGRLLIFQRVTRSRVVVVFDGPPDPALSEDNLGEGRLSVIFPPRGTTADEAILELTDRVKDRRRLFVVTSDRELRRAARSRGATVLGCAEFNAGLKEALKKSRRAREMTKPSVKPSPLEVRLWTDMFSKK